MVFRYTRYILDFGIFWPYLHGGFEVCLYCPVEPVGLEAGWAKAGAASKSCRVSQEHHKIIMVNGMLDMVTPIWSMYGIFSDLGGTVWIHVGKYIVIL